MNEGLFKISIKENEGKSKESIDVFCMANGFTAEDAERIYAATRSVEVVWEGKKRVSFTLKTKKPLAIDCLLHQHLHLGLANECELASEIIYPKHAFGTHLRQSWLMEYLKKCNRIGIPAIYASDSK